MKKKLFLLVAFLFSIILSATIQNNPKNFGNDTKVQAITFTENKGQISDQYYNPRPDVLFAGSNNGMAFHLRNNGISYQLSRIDSWKEIEEIKLQYQKRKVPDRSTLYRIDINWLNCNNNCSIKKENVLPGYNNYYLEVCPKGVHDVKSYSQIIYQNIYKGIDLKWYEKNGQLKYDYLVAAFGDYKQIQIEIQGAENIELQLDGSVLITTPLGKIKEDAPLVYQKGKLINSKWQINKNILSFKLENYDITQALVIDPGVRQWGTFYGGAGTDEGKACVTDLAGNVYLAGYTSSNSGTVIATTGSHQSSFGGGTYDAFLACFNSNGIRQWATYYGGTADDYGTSCCLDLSGNIYFAGSTQSSSGTAIATAGSHQSSFSFNTDGFLVKFNSSGTRIWGTYYGGTGSDYINGCSVDGSGNIYIVGSTDSFTPNSISTPGGHQPSLAVGGSDAFMAKFDSFGVRQWGTYYGGPGGNDNGLSSCNDALGNVYFCGGTSTSGTIIATPGSHQSTFVGTVNDAYLVKFNSSGVRQWGTFYGGIGNEVAASCAIDGANNVYIAGYTNQSTGTIIATSGSHQSIDGGGNDAFLAKFNTLGIRLWATYYGGTGSEQGQGCAVDAAGDVYLTGFTSGASGTVIATPNSAQTTFGGGADAFLVHFNSNGVRQWGTYYGGPGTNVGNSCAAGIPGKVYLTGYTPSATGTVIATVGSHQSVYGGGTTNAYLVKFCNGPNPPINSTPIANQTLCFNLSTTLTAIGSATLGWYNSSSGGNYLGGGANYITPSLSITTIFYVQDSTICSVNLRAPITVSVSPPIIVNSGTICVGQSFTMNPTGAATYTFSSGSAIVSPTTTSNYTVSGTNTVGCNGVAISTVVVNPAPLIVASNGTICLGQSFIINPTGASTYTFSSGSNSVTPTGLTSYSVTGTSTAGCLSATPAIVSVSVNPTPTVTVNSGTTCAGQAFTLSPSGANTYTYSSGSAVVSPTTTSAYSVTATDLNGCVTSTPAISNLTVNALPLINATTNNSLICSGQSATLTSSGANTYTWNTASTNTSIVVSPTVNTTYTVTGTDANGCQNFVSVTQSVSLCTGIVASSGVETHAITIYPNPSTGIFNISCNAISNNMHVEVVYTLGQLLFDQKINSENTSIDICKYAKGIYYLKVIGSDKQEVFKLIKE